MKKLKDHTYIYHFIEKAYFKITCNLLYNMRKMSFFALFFFNYKCPLTSEYRNNASCFEKHCVKLMSKNWKININWIILINETYRLRKFRLYISLSVIKLLTYIAVYTINFRNSSLIWEKLLSIESLYEFYQYARKYRTLVTFFWWLMIKIYRLNVKIKVPISI